MAIRYVWSGAAGTGTGASWANAHTTLSAAITAASAGDTYYVANDHAESTASALTLTFKGTAAAPDRILCVNRAGSVPPVAADLVASPSGSVSTTGSSTINCLGGFYCYGMNFNAGTSGSPAFSASASNVSQIYENCFLSIPSTSVNSGARISFGTTNGAQFIDLINCTVGFSASTFALQGILINGNVRWRNGKGVNLISSGGTPNALVVQSSTNLGVLEMYGLDLSAFGSGKTLVASLPIGSRLVGCKLDPSVTVAGTPTVPGSPGVDLIGCNSSGNAERNERYRYQGTLTTETTIIRTAGASDGTTPYSWKIISTANAEQMAPFETFEGALWNSAIGSAKTLTFHCVTDNVTLTNADIWVEVEYLGSSATPVTTLISSAPATVLTAGSNLTADTEAWTTTGLTTPIKQKFSVTFTPQMAGPIRWKVKVAKPSTTVYVDPNPDLT